MRPLHRCTNTTHPLRKFIPIIPRFKQNVEPSEAGFFIDSPEKSGYTDTKDGVRPLHFLQPKEVLAMKQSKFWFWVKLLASPVALIALGVLLFLNPDSASAKDGVYPPSISCNRKRCLL